MRRPVNDSFGSRDIAGALRQVTLGGCRVDLCNAATALDVLQLQLQRPTGNALAIASANLDHIWHFGVGGEQAGRIDRGRGVNWLMLLDGMPLVKAAEAHTQTSWPRLAGSDLFEPFLEVAAATRSRVGFLGGRSQMHEQLADKLSAEMPELEVVGYWAPSPAELADERANRDLVAEIARSGVDLLFVGLGKPRQELWIENHGQATGAKVVCAFGAAADMYTGFVRRAPQWVAATGLEWAYRLVQEPRRLARRYLAQGPVALARMVKPAPSSEPGPRPSGTPG